MVSAKEEAMRKDIEIQNDVVAELKWEPGLKDDDIAVGVRDGVVTLGGAATSYGDKMTAERVASRIKGVKAIANDIEVKLPSTFTRTDPDIAHAAVDAMKWDFAVPEHLLKVKVDKGWLTLEGEVEWLYQRDAAERALRYLTGVKGVTNLIQLRVHAAPADVKKKITDALHRSAQFDAEHITVDVTGNTAVLRGTVRSYTESRDAVRAAHNAPGITEVENRLAVNPEVYVGA
jgi:osmotically-inducible protein OsmY